MPYLHNPYLAIPEAKLCAEQFSQREDAKDGLSKLRSEFVIPTKGDLKARKYGFQHKEKRATAQSQDDEESIYFCGNSLGLQPRRTKEYINRYLDTWASKGVFGHFTNYEGGLPPWLHIDDAVKNQTAKIVGALPNEVVIMETLTANLHLLMASFYRPTKDRWKIIIEGKAFPSDHACCPAPPYSDVLTDHMIVCCALPDRTPQSRSFRSHHHRPAVSLGALPLERTPPVCNFTPSPQYGSCPFAWHTILLGPVLRH